MEKSSCEGNYREPWGLEARYCRAGKEHSGALNRTRLPAAVDLSVAARYSRGAFLKSAHEERKLKCGWYREGSSFAPKVRGTFRGVIFLQLQDLRKSAFSCGRTEKCKLLTHRKRSPLPRKGGQQPAWT